MLELVYITEATARTLSDVMSGLIVVGVALLTLRLVTSLLQRWV